tara:strand:- start:279 stop:497 length:219 start_codon:yes stop_codon:yes gene_type:complete
VTEETQGNNLELLSVEDIMNIMQTSRSTVQRLIRRGEIQAVPVNAPQDKKWKPLRVLKDDFLKALSGGGNID